MIVHHANPYRSTPADYPTDPASRQRLRVWRAETAPYGPAWEAVATVPAAAAGTSAHRAELAYLLAALALLCRDRARRRAHTERRGRRAPRLEPAPRASFRAAAVTATR